MDSLYRCFFFFLHSPDVQCVCKLFFEPLTFFFSIVFFFLFKNSFRIYCHKEI